MSITDEAEYDHGCLHIQKVENHLSMLGSIGIVISAPPPYPFVRTVYLPIKVINKSPLPMSRRGSGIWSPFKGEKG